MEFLLKLLSSIIDGFKTRNAKVFAVIAAVLTSLYWLIESFTTQLVPEIAAVIGSTDAAYTTLTTIKGIIVTGLTVLGAHTPKKPIGGQTSIATTPLQSAGVLLIVLFAMMFTSVSCKANYSYCEPVSAIKITKTTGSKLGLSPVDSYRYRGHIFVTFPDGTTKIVSRSRVKR